MQLQALSEFWIGPDKITPGSVFSVPDKVGADLVRMQRATAVADATAPPPAPEPPQERPFKRSARQSTPAPEADR